MGVIFPASPASAGPAATNMAKRIKGTNMNAPVRTSVTWALALCLVSLISSSSEAQRAKKFFHQSPPDLTAGGKADDARDYRLGPLGANGWMFQRRTNHGATHEARQILITAVDDDGPSHGKLKVDDVILGIGDQKFNYDARKALAQSINLAETKQGRGILKLLVWRGGEEVVVTVKLPVLGSFSKTTPFECEKTDRIIDNAVEYMKKNPDLLKPNWIGFINGLGLMATGREDVMPMVRELAHASVIPDGTALSVEHHVGMKCWDWSYRMLFLTEYYLLTKDQYVWPSINELATKSSLGQSGAGTWGHTYAARQNTGYYHGHLGGYGAINQMGLTMMIGLKLAEKCGIENAEVRAAIKRGDAFFSYFIGKGTIPYGDHGAANTWFDDNGKSGAAAIFFDLMNNRKGTRFFSEMVLGSTPGGREVGHTGHYWSRLWGGIGAARGGEKALQVFFMEINPLYTLERQPEGRFVFQENVGEAAREIGDRRTKWDSTGARLLSLCVPRRVLYITGKSTPTQTHLTPQRIVQLLRAGRLDVNKSARAKLSDHQILELLQDPLPPIRSIGAQTLAERDMNRVDRLIELLDSDNRYARLGAAEALCNAGFGSKAAADKLIELMADVDDIDFKVYAIAALINRDKKRGLLTVAKPAIPVLLKMAVKHHPEDPRRVLQHDISRALFYNGRAQPRRGLLAEYGLEPADRALLYPAMREILVNENGWARGNLGWVYRELSAEELEPLWGDIYRASRHIAPSGIMFASGIRVEGLKTMSRHRIAEGLDLAVWYIRWQKGHGNKSRVPGALEAILGYGSHARRVIPKLEEYAKWFEDQRRGGQIRDDDVAVNIHATIEKIRAMPDEPQFELVSIAKKIEVMDGIKPIREGP